VGAYSTSPDPLAGLQWANPLCGRDGRGRGEGLEEICFKSWLLQRNGKVHNIRSVHIGHHLHENVASVVSIFLSHVTLMFAF